MTTASAKKNTGQKKAPASKRPDRSKPKRVPLGHRDRLTFGEMEEGFNYRVVSDSKLGRVDKALAGGYEFVHSEEQLGDTVAAEAASIDSRVSKPVGNGATGWLMRFKSEWYNEDQAAKEAELKETEKGLQPKK